MQPGSVSQEECAPPRSDTAIVGHRLAGGYMSIHAPGQPCDLCSAATAIPASWRRIGSTRRRPGDSTSEGV